MGQLIALALLLFAAVMLWRSSRRFKNRYDPREDDLDLSPEYRERLRREREGG